MSKNEKGKGRGRGRGAGRGAAPPTALTGLVETPRPGDATNGHAPDLMPDVVRRASPVGRGRGRRSNSNSSPESVSPVSVSPDREIMEEMKQLTILDLKEEKDIVRRPTAKKAENQLAIRPGYGEKGTPIDLVTNYYKLNFKNIVVYHYDVDINSIEQQKKYGKKVTKMTEAEAIQANISRSEILVDRSMGRIKCREIFDTLVRDKALEQFSPVYDGGRNVYTRKQLPFLTKEKPKFVFKVSLEINGKTREYEITIQPANRGNNSNVIDFETLGKSYDGKIEMINVMSCIINYRKPRGPQIQIGKHFFYSNQDRPPNIGEGLEIWFGYNQNIHVTQRGLAIVVDLSAKAFHKSGPALDYVSDVLGRDITRTAPLRTQEVRKLEEALRGVKVTATHLRYKRKYIIQAISQKPASDLRMDYEGSVISIADYYRIKYKSLQYPNLPCFLMKSNNQTYIPFENCLIVEGQPKIGKMSANTTSKMIRQTAVPPGRRFEEIQKNARNVTVESGEKMSDYNLLMELQPFFVRGRVIAAPSLRYNNPKNPTAPDSRGVWRMDNKSFFQSTDIPSWILLCFAEKCSQQSLEKFVSTLNQTGRKVGLKFGQFLGIRKFGYRDGVEKALVEAEKTRASFAMIVLSRFDSVHNYDEIKFIADYRLGFITQCIEQPILEKINDQIANNLCLKINTKMGGVNHILNEKLLVFAKPVIVFGADAVHAMRDSPCPSIASVVASMDAFPSKYKVECRVQENKKTTKQAQEIILELKAMVVKLLQAFYHSVRGKYPEKILFFRDGVSEGQFQTVRDQEVKAIQEASVEVIGYIVPITFVVVQKRHQTRLRPKNPKDAVNKMGNIPPGTTVDRDITNPGHFDYFLNSHEGIQGTSKPAHYTVLYDDNKFNADDLQSLSYHLCYLYGKCNRSISIPTPVMYADLACYRAKKYADFHLQKERERMSGSSGDSRIKLPDHVRAAINTMGDFKKNMFFL